MSGGRDAGSLGISLGGGGNGSASGLTIGNGDAAGGSNAGNAAPFFIPSYLRGTRYADRLEEHRRVQMAAQREKDMQAAQVAQASGGAHQTQQHQLGSSIGGHGFGGFRRSPHSSAPGSLSTSGSSANLHKLGGPAGPQSGPAAGSHRGLAHDVIERAPPSLVDDAPAPLPSRWSETDKYSGLEIVDADGLELRYTPAGKTHSDEAAAVRADHAMPRACGVYYFEVTMLSKSKEGLVGIGFSGPKVPLSRLPGWEPDSWAYHGDDGYVFCCTVSGKNYGPRFGTADVVGCGINFRTGEVFFTKNGNDLGVTFDKVKHDKLFPSVGMKRPGEHLKVNFGKDPFVFDIDGKMETQKRIIHEDIHNTSVVPLYPPAKKLGERALIHELVAQFLAHDGYVETARAFAQEVRQESKAMKDLLGNGSSTGERFLEPVEDEDAVNRQKIRAAILEGDVDKALAYTDQYYPSVLRENENIYFKLRCRKFIEMIRRCTELQIAAAAAAEGRPESFTVNPTRRHNAAATATAAANGHGAPPDDYDVFDSQMELDDHVASNGTAATNGRRGGGGASGGTMSAQPTKLELLSSAAAAGSSGGAGAGVGGGEGEDDLATLTARELHSRYSRLLAATIGYGQELKAEFAEDPRREVKRALEDTFALIAYPDARESALGHLLEEEGRVPVAEELNAAVLVSLGRCSAAALERVVGQCEVLVQEVCDEGGQGAFVNVKRDFLRG
ncbi:hypothetical protein BDY21DRAFT_388112 [Lineolata rhizophorae]|uniref:Uncharacterized protein n=1 Tax=Lineolata rhizophorae TaxID=578093 RepID=A0A6A6NP99_9PEZI|nr:hypothetical protein BDY21DRAFT_388112 [Lineolata rhizophorae]